MAKPSERNIENEYRDLCVVVGHLFITFARLEGGLTAALKLHLGNQFDGNSSVSAALPAAIYGGMRFRSARDVIKRIMVVENTPTATRDFILNIFEQVGHIEMLRDYLAHQQTVPAQMEGAPYWQITDLVSTKSLKDTKIFVISPDQISAAANDLVRANDRLSNIRVEAKLFVSDRFDASPIPWQYKSSMLKLVPRSKERAPLGERRPPQ